MPVSRNLNMPYAGYFSELADRDIYIKENNNKIAVETVKNLVNDTYPDVIFIDPIVSDQIEIKDTITVGTSKKDRKEIYTEEYIDRHLSQEITPPESTLIEQLTQYFQSSDFFDELLLYIIPCNEQFSPIYKSLSINFSTRAPTLELFKDEDSLLANYNKNMPDLRKLLIKVRAPALWDVIRNYKSWEELSIGFQCRIHRTPDVYNSKFWYHFSNIYIQ